MSELPDPKDYLALLSWHDILERQDMLILEIRHLQVNIIHALRAPFLYSVLREEESRLWGQNWECGEEELNDARSLANLVNDWIPSYPNMRGKSSASGSTAKDDVDFQQDVNEELKKNFKLLWNSSSWGRDQRRHYHLLEGLQALKKDIFRDKLLLCCYANNSIFNSVSNKKNNRAKLFVLRSAIIYRIEKQIAALDNYQNAFSKAMDVGVQDHPKPSVERRRELGIYTDYLSDRCRDLMGEMLLMMKSLGERKKYFSTQVILHRWRHDHTSRTTPIDDEVADLISDPDEPTPSRRFIATSYFMPERPDLQPVIAHEVAHCVIRDYLFDFKNHYFFDDGHFSFLLNDLFGAIKRFIDNYGFPGTAIDPEGLVREIAADILAASVKGSAYLYALFLEIFGKELHHILAAFGERVDPFLIFNSLSEAPFKALLKREQWYIRLKVVVKWMELTHHGYVTELDLCLMKGIDGLCEELSEGLDKYLPNREKARGEVWKQFSKYLLGVLEDHRDYVCAAVKQWRARRSIDRDSTGSREFPRSSLRLSKEVRNLLYKITISGKRKKSGRLLDANSTCSDFQEAYGLVWRRGCELNEDDVDKDGHLINFLFRHIYDVPWQSSMMRAMDVIGGRSEKFSKGYREDLIYKLHNDFSLGRSVYSLALEFYMWRSENAARRLISVVGLVRDLYGHKRLCDSYEKLRGEIGKWLDEQEYEIDKKDNLIARGARGLVNIDIREFNLPSSKANKYHRKCGEALEHLLEILKNSWEHVEEYEKSRLASEPSFMPLYNYISIRGRCVDDDSKPNKNDFYSALERALLFEYDSAHVEAYFKLTSVMLGRLSLSGSYVVPEWREGDTQSYRLPFCRLLDVLSIKKHQFQYRHIANRELHRMETVLGRYDLVLWGETNFLCRCPLPILDERYLIGEQGEPDKWVGGSSPEIWPSFFARREMALVAKLGEEAIVNPERPVIAFLAVTLQRRPYRLDFLYRLLGAANKLFSKDYAQQAEQAEQAEQEPQTLEEVGCYIHSSDFAFLTDGWGDLIIAFVAPEEEVIEGKKAEDPQKYCNRLKEIFVFQKAVFQDFMVDRTELILSSRVVDYLAKDDENEWGLFARVRILEDNSLLPSDHKYEEYIKNIAKKYNVGVYHIPGRLDYMIDFSCGTNKNAWVSKERYKFFGMGDDNDVDLEIEKIDTTVGEKRL